MAQYSFNLRSSDSIEQEIRKAIAQGKDRFIFHNSSETLFTHFFNKIERIANRFPEIDSKHFILAVGSANADTVYKQLVTQTNILRPISIICSHTFEYVAKTYLNKPFLDAVGDYTIKTKSKKFLCFNKVHRHHRVILTAELLKLGLVDQSYYSFEGALPDWIDTGVQYKSWDKDTTTTILNNKDRFPIRLNITPDRSNPVDLNVLDTLYHSDSYFSLITETVFYDKNTDKDTMIHSYENTVFISEKTYNAIGFKHPFILLALPGTLAELKRQGYQTFSPWIDETYDTIENDDRRMQAVIDEVQRLTKFTDQQWIDWQTAIKPIVEHNLTKLCDSMDYNSTIDIDKIFN